jgi:flagellar biosynthesis protein FlhA
MDRLLAMNSGSAEEELNGLQVKEPAFGLPAVWIPPFDRERAEVAGYTVVEPSAVLSTHLQEILRRNSDKILGRQDTKKLIENLKKEYPAVVEDLTPELLPMGSVEKVLQNLLREGVPIRDLVTILEALVDYARVTKNVDVLTEYVRHSLSGTIAHLYGDAKGVVHGVMMGPRLEQLMTATLQNQKESSPSLGLSPAMIESIQASMRENIEAAMAAGTQPVVLCAATVRPYFYRLIHTAFPTVTVLSFTELPADTEIEFTGKVELDHAN